MKRVTTRSALPRTLGATAATLFALRIMAGCDLANRQTSALSATALPSDSFLGAGGAMHQDIGAWAPNASLPGRGGRPLEV